MKDILKKILLIAAVMLTILALPSECAQAAGKIRFQKKSLAVTLYTSQKKELKVIVPKKFRDKKVIFTSKKPDVVKVSRKKGVVTALRKGKATVIAQVKGTKAKAKAKVTVLQGVSSMSIPNASTHYYVGEKYYLSARTYPQYVDEKILWSSSDPSIAEISNRGALLIKDDGHVSITAFSAKTGKKASLSIYAEYYPQIRIKEGSDIFCEYGDSLQLHLEYINHPVIPMTFSIPENDDIISITPSGYIQTTRPGTACITASSADNKFKVTATLHIKISHGFISGAMLGNLGIDDCTNLMIVAHPDDETLWGGAHLMTGKWFVLCLTNQYFDVRKKEYFNVLNKLGIKGIILDYPDVYKGFNNKWLKDGWNYEQEAIAQDIETVVKYKNWDQIVTHSPTGETGHGHHLKTDRVVVSVCSKDTALWNKLWFFGKFYERGAIPANLKSITQEQLAFKEDLLKLYARETGSIQKYWAQMNPYENWEKATEYNGPFLK